MEEERSARINRLKWHCRRALLELDLVFQRFWARVDGSGKEEDFDAATETALRRLLELEDHELWALVSGREHTNDPELQGIIERLRAV